jgi:hypothetical protein
MKKSESPLKNALYLLPRLILWSICMLYVFITVIVTFDMSVPYLYPLEYLRHHEASGKRP